MVKFKKLWLFERSEFQRFLNFIIVQFIAEIRPGSEIIYMNIYICLEKGVCFKFGAWL